MRIIFYTLLCSLLFVSIQAYTNYSSPTYTLRHHNGLLEQGTNTAQPINPGIRIPYYFDNSYTFSNYSSELQMFIAFTLIINDGSYGHRIDF